MGMGFIVIICVVCFMFVLIQYALFLQLPFKVKLFFSSNLFANTALNIVLSFFLMMFTSVGAIAGIANLFASIPVSYLILRYMKPYMPTYYILCLGFYKKTNYNGITTSQWGWFGLSFVYSSRVIDKLEQTSYNDLIRQRPDLINYDKKEVVKYLRNNRFSTKSVLNKLAIIQG